MQAARTGSKQHAPAPHKSYNILLVEDEGLIARDIAQRLEALGHRVTAIVSTGEEAIEAAQGADVILMDIRLDGSMDGIEAARAIRRRFHVPVVFLTAHADRSVVERAKLVEPYGYIVKPVAPAALHTSIEIAVYKHAIERELVEREAWLRAVLSAVTDAVAVADIEGRVRILNPAAESLTGWREAEAAGQPLARIVPLAADAFTGPSADGASMTQRVTQPSAQSLREEGPVALALLRDAPVPLDRDAHLIARGGRAVPVEGTAAPVHAGEETIGVVLSLRDVSHRRWQEQQIRQAQSLEAAARLAAGVAGEYSHLLAAIRTQAERLLDQFANYSPARRSAEEIRQAATSAEEITRRLAGFAKRPPAHLEVMSPNAVLRRMAKLLEGVAGAGVSVTIRPGLHAGKTRADEAQFEQLLMSLMAHAAERVASGGEIRIETEAAAASVDSATGASGDFIRIGVACHPLARPSQEEGVDPAGDLIPDDAESLTLAAAHHFAREHGGFFSLRRTGDGSVYLEVLLPRWSEPASEPSPEPASSIPTVLLVEPREIVRAELHKFFEANGFNLLEAADAAEAVALAEVRDGPLDLVIATALDAGQIYQALAETRPELALLRIVDETEHSRGELRRTFTQTALLDRIRLILNTRNENNVQNDNRQKTRDTAAAS